MIIGAEVFSRLERFMASHKVTPDTATGADLDAIGAFLGVNRQVLIRPGTGDDHWSIESDQDFRPRVCKEYAAARAANEDPLNCRCVVGLDIQHSPSFVTIQSESAEEQYVGDSDPAKDWRQTWDIDCEGLDEEAVGRELHRLFVLKGRAKCDTETARAISSSVAEFYHGHPQQVQIDVDFP